MGLLMEESRVRRRWETKKSTELIVFEENLIHRVLNRAKVEDGFTDQESVVFALKFHDIIAKNIVPDLSLRVPVYHISSLEGQHIEQA